MSEGLPSGAPSFASWFWAKQPENSEKVQISKGKQCVINTVIILTLLAQQQKNTPATCRRMGVKKTLKCREVVTYRGNIRGGWK